MIKNASDITWWDKLKHAIARMLLSTEIARVDLERETFLRLQEDLKRQKELFRDEREAYTVTDMVREQLQAFDPRMLDDEDDLPTVLDEVEGQDSFLAKMKTLNENKEFALVVAYLTRNQIMHIAKYADTTEKQNFGRATINGFELLKDEIARLATIYADRHAKEPEFDEHEVV